MVSRVLAGRRLATLLCGVVVMFVSAASAFAQDQATPNPFADAPSADLSTSPATAGPTIVSDKDDYPPGGHVVLTGGDWQPGESVQIYVQDDQGQSWSERGTAVAGDDGTLTYELNLPNYFVAVYSVEATGEVSGVARTSFTDGNVKVENAPGVPAGVTLNYTLVKYSNATTCGGTSTSATVVLTGPGDDHTFPGGVGTTDRYTLSVSSTAGTVTVSPTASGCPAGQNGSLTYFGSVPASKQNQTITFTAPTGKTYGDADFSLGATATSGLPVGYSSSTASVCTVTSGTLHIVSAGDCTITATQAGNASYNAAAPVERTFAIAKAGLSVLASSPSVIYGDQVPAITPSYDGFVNGDDASDLTTAPSCSTVYVDGSGVLGSPYTSSCEGGVADNYAFTYVGGGVTVDPAEVTVTASSPTVTYGAVVPVISPSYGGFVNGEDESELTADPLCSTSYVQGSGVSGSPYSSSCEGAVADNYSFGYVPGEVVVDPKSVEVSASGASVTYGDGAPAISASYDGFVDDEDDSVLTTAADCSTTYVQGSGVAGSPYPSSCTGAAADNYTFTYTDGEVTVAKAPLTANVSTETITYGDAVPTFTASYDGWIFDPESVNGDLDCDSTDGHGAGTHDVTCSGLSAANYDISYSGGSLVIDQATLYVDAADATMTYGGSAPTLSASLRGFKGTDTAATSGITGDEACTIPGGTERDAGTYQDAIECGPGTLGAANYTFAAGNKGTLTIDQANQTITFAAIGDKQLAAADFAPGATASPSGLTVEYSVGTSTACSIVDDKVRILAIGSCTVTASQSGNVNYVAATPVSRTFKVVYGWGGFLQPINDTAHQIGVNESKFKIGSTVPVKFRLTDASGTPVQASLLPTFKYVFVNAACDTSTYTEPVLTEPADAGSAFKWDAGLPGYHYNFSTKSITVKGEYRVYAIVHDGITRTVDICLTK